MTLTKSIAKYIGVSNGVFHSWIRQYHHSGERAFEKRYTSYPMDYKLKVLDYMNEQGLSSRETSAIFNIPSSSTVTKWKIAFETEGVDALIPKKKGRPPMKKQRNKKTKKQAPEGSVEALQDEVDSLRMENAYLKKLNALVQNKEKSPNKTKRK